MGGINLTFDNQFQEETRLINEPAGNTTSFDRIQSKTIGFILLYVRGSEKLSFHTLSLSASSRFLLSEKDDNILENGNLCSRSGDENKSSLTESNN